MHNFAEYMGELYRMNLSCNSSEHGEMPTNGCLFFKVFGKTMITEGILLNLIPCQNDNTYVNASSKKETLGIIYLA